MNGTSAPLRGRRVVAVMCPVQGHPHCEVAKVGEPPSRVSEKRAVAAEVMAELDDPR